MFLFGVLLIAGGRFLVVQQTLVPSDMIVILSGNDSTRIQRAAELYHNGYADRIMLTNTGQEYGEYNTPYALLQLEELKKLNIPEGAIYRADFEAKNTGQEATGIIMKMFDISAKSAIIVTDTWHTRRVKIIFSDSFGNTNISLQFASSGDPSDVYRWWMHLDGWRQVPGEYIRIIGYLIKKHTNIPDYPDFDFLQRIF